jgi:hypothetical protein
MNQTLTCGIIFALTASGALLPGRADAQEVAPMVTDRPDFTESASTVAPGRFQLELGYTFTKSGTEERHDFGELLLRLGILSWLEGRLGLNSFSQIRAPGENREGLEDVTASFKAILFRKLDDSPAAPQVALLFGARIPTGESGFGEDEVQPAVLVAMDFALTERLSLGSNLGWSYLHSDGERFHQGLGSVVLGFGITDPLTAFIEWYGFFPENRGGGSNHYLDTGLGWALGASFQLDWRIGVGLQEPDPNWFTGAGLSFRL